MAPRGGLDPGRTAIYSLVTRKSPSRTWRATLCTGTVPIAPVRRPWWAWPWNTASGRCAPIGTASRPEPRNAQIPSGSPTIVSDHGCVVEQDEPSVAAGDSFQPGFERLDLLRRLGIDLAEQPLAEVRDLRTREAADEALRPDHADLHPGHLEDDVSPVEDDDARVLERGGDICPRARCGGRGSRARRATAAAVRAHASASTAASSTSPCVVRSPARRTTSASSSPNDRSRWSRCSSDAWMSPTAATVSTLTRRSYPDSGFELPHAGYDPRMSTTANDTFPELVDTMKKAAAALREADVPFLLGGGLAAWARGGPPTDHDVDLLVRQQDAERALEALAEVRDADGATARRLAPQGVGRRRCSSTSSSAPPAAPSTTRTSSARRCWRWLRCRSSSRRSTTSSRRSFWR